MQKLIWIIPAILMTACIKTIPAVKVAEESMVQNCEYVATLSEAADPGKLFYNYPTRESQQDKILERAANLRATHVVWIYDYQMGSAAMAYRCDR